MFKCLVFCLTLCPRIYEISCRDEDMNFTLSEQSSKADEKNSTVGLHQYYNFNARNIIMNFGGRLMHPIDDQSLNSGANVSSERNIPFGYVEKNGIGAFKIQRDSATWFDARKICKEEHAHLAVIRSAAEEAIVREIMNEHSVLAIWVGVHDQFSEGKWITIFDEDLSEAGWTVWVRYGSDTTNQYDCATFVGRFEGLYGAKCKDTNKFLCKI